MKHLIGHNVEDFKVQAYHQGDFKEITLQDTKGHWSVSYTHLDVYKRQLMIWVHGIRINLLLFPVEKMI